MKYTLSDGTLRWIATRKGKIMKDTLSYDLHPEVSIFNKYQLQTCKVITKLYIFEHFLGQIRK